MVSFYRRPCRFLLFLLHLIACNLHWRVSSLRDECQEGRGPRKESQSSEAAVDPWRALVPCTFTVARESFIPHWVMLPGLLSSAMAEVPVKVPRVSLSSLWYCWLMFCPSAINSHYHPRRDSLRQIIIITTFREFVMATVHSSQRCCNQWFKWERKNFENFQYQHGILFELQYSSFQTRILCNLSRLADKWRIQLKRFFYRDVYGFYLKEIKIYLI